MCAPLLVAYIVIELIRGTRPLAVALRASFFLYVVGLVSVTLFPMPVTHAEVVYTQALPQDLQRQFNLMPFASMLETLRLPARAAALQLVGNFMLLFPLGYLAPLLWPRLSSLARVARLVVLTALAIEGLQFGISLLLGSWYKSVDVDDIILNVAGGCIGYLAHTVMAPHLAAFDFSRSQAERNP
ncbi:MAG: VanZ family protein [Actinobacteria bacterium]|nr:VanZ family protein [Actinomycetota bacterium]